MTKSFFEYIGLADVERIHSQFLAWVFSEDCNAIEATEKQNLLKTIFSAGGQIEQIQTERNRIDILIQTSTDIVVIENKIKSSQHSNQLSNYKQYCDKEFPSHRKHFFFLTLIDEKTSEKDWQRISYSIIYRHLTSLKLKENNTHSSIINEYLIFLKRLDEVVAHFAENVKQYDMVFLDGKKKKQDKKRTDYKTENEWFIASNQLETILQKSYLSLLVEQVKTPIGFITDTRGDALVDFPLQDNINYEGRNYSTILQLQEDTIKFAFAIYGNDYTKSKKEWVSKVIPLMKKMSEENTFGYRKLNPPKSKAYISISKKLKEHYWHLSLDDLTKFVRDEIENGKELTKTLTKLLTT